MATQAVSLDRLRARVEAMARSANASLSLEFDGRLHGTRAGVLEVMPGRHWFARLLRSPLQHVRLTCLAAEGWQSRLFIDGVAVGSPGNDPHP
ncbi:hypothetical protein KPL74_15235 [Bacillus sp. NP157]|nr:hypothetical protein KPL74_15235 [Bacillus sp. NP157]